jgi:hypothetical protein
LRTAAQQRADPLEVLIVLQRRPGPTLADLRLPGPAPPRLTMRSRRPQWLDHHGRAVASGAIQLQLNNFRWRGFQPRSRTRLITQR